MATPALRRASASGVQVFAGRRSDPFFLNVRAIEKTIATGRIAFEKVGSDTLYGTNVLSIVLELEWAKLLDGGPMFAIVCETLRAGPRPVRFERLGRPEIKNVTLSLKLFDRVNRDLEIRDLYNSEDAFALTPDYLGAYRARFNANMQQGWFVAINQIINNISVLAIFLCGAAVLREREHGNIEHLLVMPLRPFELATAKIAGRERRGITDNAVRGGCPASSTRVAGLTVSLLI